MFGFGRKRQRGPDESRDEAERTAGGELADADAGDDQDPADGPYDEAAPESDQRSRIDLGSLRFPLPEGAQLQVEVDQSGPVRAVHLATGSGRLTVNAFAAPRSGGLWGEVRKELMAKLREDGSQVTLEQGDWGPEVVVIGQQARMRFIGVDGPRWLLRAVWAGSAEQAEAGLSTLRELVRQTVVVRGEEALPVRTPLPITLPDELAERVKHAQAQRSGEGATQTGQPAQAQQQSQAVQSGQALRGAQ